MEPRTFYSVSRAKREFSDQSSLGFIFTTTNRQIPETLTFIPTAATTGGADFDWRLGRRWGLNGYWAGSHVTGSPEAIDTLQQSTVHSFQRPDADHVELDPLADTLRGHSGGLNFNKLAGQRTRGNVGIGYKSPGFDTNDVGFMQPRRSHPAERLGGRSAGPYPASTSATSTSTSTSGRRSTSTAIGWTWDSTSTRTGSSRTSGAPASASTSTSTASTIG